MNATLYGMVLGKCGCEWVGGGNEVLFAHGGEFRVGTD